MRQHPDLRVAVCWAGREKRGGGGKTDSTENCNCSLSVVVVEKLLLADRN